MSTPKQFLSCFLPVALLFASIGAAASGNNTTIEVLQPSHVTRVATALNHVTVIQFPEPVVSASVGSELVRMEWHDNRVLIQPLKSNVETNMTVWTASTRSTYEILPAGNPDDMAYVIDEVFPTPPPPPPGPSPAEVQRATDATLANALTYIKFINNRMVKNSKKTATIRIKEVTEDSSSYYVHLAATNHSRFPFRLTPPTVAAIRPAFAENVPARYLRKQITKKTLAKFGLYNTETLTVHGSTLDSRDLASGGETEWVVAISKPARSPGIYLFTFVSERNPVERDWDILGTLNNPDWACVDRPIFCFQRATFMDELTTVSPEECVKVMESCFARGNAEKFGEFLKRFVQDPIQPRDEKNRFRLHPVLMALIAFGGLGVLIMLLCTYWHK